MTRIVLKLAVIFSAQAVMAWFFYRCEVISHAFWAGSDLVVFGLPLLVGFAAAASVLFVGFHRKRVGVTIGLSVIGAVIASNVGMLVAVNLYGT